MIGADHFAQGILGFHQPADRLDFLADRQVIAGLSGLDVGDGDQPDFESLRGLIQLAADGLFFRFSEFQVVLGIEHLEVTLGHLDHQFLFRRQVGRFGAGDLAVRLFQLNPAVITKQGLGQVDAGGSIGRAVGRLRLIEVLDAQARQAAISNHFGQQACQRLRPAFAHRLQVGGGGGELRVCSDGFIVDGDQIGTGDI